MAKVSTKKKRKPSYQHGYSKIFFVVILILGHVEILHERLTTSKIKKQVGVEFSRLYFIEPSRIFLIRFGQAILLLTVYYLGAQAISYEYQKNTQKIQLDT